MARTYHVYILSNPHRTVLYIGVTGNLPQRIYHHQQGKGSTFTKQYNVMDLLYAEPYEYVDDALCREKQLKGWSHAKKLALIRRQNPTLATQSVAYGH